MAIRSELRMRHPNPAFFNSLSLGLHGFPFKPTAAAFDPVQKVLAIGNRYRQGMLLGHGMGDFRKPQGRNRKALDLTLPTVDIVQ
jgi:hypothetical protein